ncbi:MAG: hypothetical protein LBK27_08925 [Treponema sp.]|nr:hypothetical protein [Treponema sp.]
MKQKIGMVLVLGVVFSGMVFAADPYVVQSVAGKVEREVSPGKWEPVAVGASLTAATVINTGLNSTLVLKNGDKTVTIRAMQKGTVENLAAAGSASGVRIGGKISSSNTAVNARGTSNTSTASTRASEAVADVEWAE